MVAILGTDQKEDLVLSDIAGVIIDRRYQLYTPQTGGSGMLSLFPLDRASPFRTDKVIN